MIYLGFDIGGTKIRGYRVIPSYRKGRLVRADLDENVFSEPELKTRNFQNPKELSELVYKAVKRFGSPKKVVVSGAIAGVINPETLDAVCANVHFPLTFLGDLKNMGYRSFAFNDLFANGTALSRLGPGRNYSVVAVQNIGSGNNIACARNGVVFTRGTEAGHQAYIDSGVSCGCGGSGHLETYASGNGAALLALTYFKTHPGDRKHPILEEALKEWNLENRKRTGMEKLNNDSFWREIVFSIQGRHVMAAYSKFPEQNPQKEIRRLERNGIAYQLGQITGLHQPELIIMRGSFVTENWTNLGKPAVQRFLSNYERFVHPAIERPKIERKKVKKDGVIGAVLCAIDEIRQE